MKRHHFKGGSMTHGQSDRQRSPGGIGACKTPGRVVKGKRMAGHMGDERSTVEGLKVVMVDPERNLLAVRGAIPGAKNGLVIIRQARKTRVMKKVRK
jgi:large subunit ribosomal protein L3